MLMHFKLHQIASAKLAEAFPQIEIVIVCARKNLVQPQFLYNPEQASSFHQCTQD